MKTELIKKLGIILILLLIGTACSQFSPNLDIQINALKKAIRENPYNAEAYFELGLVYETQGRYRKSKEALWQAIKLNPNHAKAYNLLGRIFEKDADYTLAIDHYEKAIQSEDHFMEPYILLAGLYREMGIKSTSQDFRQKQMKILSAALTKCDRENDKSSCITILNNLSVLILEIQANNKNSDLSLAVKYAQQGLELMKDERDLKKYVKYNSDNKQIHLDRGLFHYLLGDAYQELNRPEQALNEHNNALSEFKQADNKYWISKAEAEVKEKN